MPIYILLSTLTQQGVQTLKSNPERLRQVNKDIEELGCTRAPPVGDARRVRLHQRRRGARHRDGREGVGRARRARLDADRDAAGARGRGLPPHARVVRKWPVVGRCARRGVETPDACATLVSTSTRALLVERSLGVQPGWQVRSAATQLARPLVEAVIEQIARRGAYPILQLQFEQIGGPFAREAPLEVLREPAPLQQHIWERSTR